MKKSILLLAVMLLSGICANATDWQPINTSFPYTKLYIDVDSMIFPNYNQCLYALKYQIADKPEKIAYIKSDFDTNCVGIIRVVDADREYQPNGELSDQHVFMKPVPEKSFLNDVHRYAVAYSKGYNIANAQKTIENDINNFTDSDSDKSIIREDLLVAYRSENQYVTNSSVQNYLERTCKLLEENWNPPASGHTERTIIYVTIGADGSLLNYKIAESSGEDLTDRSVISAVEKSVPYMRLPSIANKEVYSMDFKFVFEHDLIKKSVVY